MNPFLKTARNEYYLADTSYIQNNTSFTGTTIGDIWHNIILSITSQPTLNVTNSMNISDPNQLTFNITIMSELDVRTTSYIILPTTIQPNYNDYPITLNLNCAKSSSSSSPCIINIIDGVTFINVIQYNSNATKLVLSINSLVYFMLSS